MAGNAAAASSGFEQRRSVGFAPAVYVAVGRLSLDHGSGNRILCPHDPRSSDDAGYAAITGAGIVGTERGEIPEDQLLRAVAAEGRLFLAPDNRKLIEHV
jgi:hypothetical protein